ncbi:MAG TPA: hypothetical protein VK698_16675 [Kofleriaceae bacterium]|nr:hypothetical protein [Kofleriaceae bacterium]
MVTRRRPDSKLKLLVLHNRAGRGAGSSDPAPEAVPADHAALDHLRSLADGLGESGFEVALVDAEDDNQRITHAVVVEQPALVFLLDHFEGEALRHPSVASLLDLRGLTYTGSDPLCLSTCRDRVRTHLMLSDAEVPVPPYAVVRDINAIPDTAAIEPPMLVSHAIDHGFDDPDARALAHTRAEVEERASALAAGPGLPILIERFIDGRRVQAVVLGNRVLEVLPLSERAPGLDGRLGPARIAQLDVDTADAIRALAQRAFRVMGCRDCAQIDFALDGDGRPYVLDVRPVFDMFPDSPFVVGAGASELGVTGAVAHLADIALERVESAAPPASTEPDGSSPVELEPEAEPEPEPEAATDPEPVAAEDSEAPPTDPDAARRARPPTPRRRPASRSRVRAGQEAPAPAENRESSKSGPAARKAPVKKSAAASGKQSAPARRSAARAPAVQTAAKPAGRGPTGRSGRKATARPATRPAAKPPATKTPTGPKKTRKK